MRSNIKTKRGSDNVFADLGFPDPATHALKAGLVSRIQAIITEHGLNQVEAGERMGLCQPDVSRLLRGQFRDVSVERLMRMLNNLGCDIDIVIREHSGKASAKISIHFEAMLA